MNTFVCYTLEGLLQQDYNQVWVMLGSYATQEEARTAKFDAVHREDLTDTRVMSYIRDADWWKKPAPQAPVLRPLTAPSPARCEEPTIVA